MKRNTLKRVLAGSLALLTVAAYFPANVGKGIADTISLVASARDAAIDASADGINLNTIEKGDYFEEATILRKPSSDTNVTYNVTLTTSAFEKDGATISSDTTISNVTEIKYVVEDNKKKLVITSDHGSSGTVSETTLTLVENNKFVRVTNLDDTTTNNPDGTTTDTVTYTLDTVAVANAALDFEAVSKYIQSVTFIGAGSGKQNTYNNIVDNPTVNAKQKTAVTVKATAKLQVSAAGDMDEYLTGFADGVYTYEFNAVEGKTFALTQQGLTLNGDAEKTTVLYADVTEAETVSGTSGETKLPIGAQVTIASDKPFTIKDGAFAGYENNKLTTKDVNGVYTDGQFQATFSFSGVLNDEAVKKYEIKLGALPTTIQYTTNKNKVTASDTSADKVITDAVVASAVATSYVPVYTDNKKTTIKQENGKAVYTTTEIAEGKSVNYNTDANAMVKLALAVDPALTDHNNQNVDYEIVLTKDQKKVATLAYNDINHNLVLTKYKEDGTEDTKVTATNLDTSPSDLGGIYTYLKDKGIMCDEFITETDSVGGTATYALATGVDLTKGLTLVTNNAGVYKAELSIWPMNNKTAASTAVYNYTIKPITTISDVELTATYVGGSVDSEEIVKNADGVYEVPVTVTNGTVPSVTLSAAVSGLDAGDISLTEGTTLGSMTDTATAVLSVTNPNFKVADMNIKWKLVEAAVEDAILFNAQKNYPNNADINMIDVTIDNLETVVKNCLTSTNDIDVSKATFKFTKGTPLDADTVDIDSLSQGLPTVDNLTDAEKKKLGLITDPSVSEASSYPKFFIYASVGSFETAAPLKITVKNEATAAIPVNAVLTKTNFVYGEKIEKEDISFVTADGTKVEGLTAASIDFNKFTVIQTANDVTDEKNLNNSITTNDASALIPGTYTVILENSNGAGVTISAEDGTVYDVKTASGILGTNPDAEAIAAKTKALTATFTVAKKQLDDSMASELNVQLTSGNAVVTNAILNGEDTIYQTPIVTGVKKSGSPETVKVAIVSGTNSKKSVSTNNKLVVQPTGTSAKYYTGTCTVHWNAVNTATAPAFRIEVDKDNYNLYDDQYGLTINVEANITKDGSANPSATELNGYKITKFGLLVQKNGDLGKVEDITNASAYNAKQTEVETKLRYGCGYTETSGALNGSNGLRHGIGATVSTIDDYVWVRPYAVTESGYVVYGKAEYMDFLTVANQVVQPQLQYTKLVQDGNSLYYYAYATKRTKTSADNAKTVEPKAFGVVISRTGNHADVDKSTVTVGSNSVPAITIDGALAGNYDNGKAADGLTELTDAQKAYVAEIKNVAANLSVDTCDVKSTAVTTAYYNTNECGTLMRIVDSTSNVYVSTYVDYGNGMVVYSNPQVIESASAQLATAMNLVTEEALNTVDAANPKYLITAKKSDTDTTIDGSGFTFTTKAAKTESFDAITIDLAGDKEDKSNRITDFGLIIDKDGKSSAKTDLVLNSSYMKLSYTKTTPPVATALTFGASTKATNKNAAGRAYAVYKGVEVYANNHVKNDQTADKLTPNGSGYSGYNDNVNVN